MLARMEAAALTGSDVLRRRGGLAWRRIQDEAVILDIDGKVLRGINVAGWHVWELLDGQRSLAEISAVIASRYSISPDRALNDVLEFAEQLARGGLLERPA